MRPPLAPLDRDLLMDTLNRKYGYDFRGYTPSSLDRRFGRILSKYALQDAAELLSKLLRDPVFFTQILPDLTIGTTEMFRDPSFYLALREQVIPVLKTFASLNIWIAGCSTGQEAYSMAILLKEEGLFDRSVLFATDINPLALERAREGIFPADSLQVYKDNYVQAGGTGTFSDYYVADYGFARMDSELKDNMVFSEHSLVTDQVFTEANLVLCRNVLIYFDRETQNRALHLMHASLRYKGFLCLGSKENLRFSEVDDEFDVIDSKSRIYQKNGKQSA